MFFAQLHLSNTTLSADVTHSYFSLDIASFSVLFFVIQFAFRYAVTPAKSLYRACALDVIKFSNPKLKSY